MNIRERTAVKIKSSLGKSPKWIPLRLRNVVRMLSGGDSRAGQLIRGLFWKYRYFVFLALTASIFAAAFEGSTFAILTVALETLSEGGNLENLGRWGVWLQAWQDTLSSTQFFFILIGLAVVSQIMRSGLQFLGQAAASYITAWSEGDLRRRLFRQYVTMSYAKTNSYKIGDLVSYTEQTTQIGSLLISVNKLISVALVVIAYVVVLLWLSWSVTLLALLGLLILSLLMGRIIRKVRRFSRRFVDAAVAMNAHVVEYLSGLRVIHTFSREEYVVKRTNRIIDEGVRARRQALIWRATVDPLVEATAITGLAVLLAVGLGMAEYTDGASISRLGVFMLVMYRLLPRITTMNTFVAGINNWLPFAERIAEMLRSDDKEYMRSGTRPFPTFKREIVFDQVSLRYDKEGETAVADLSFVIKQGETIAFVGVSGAGKSTIINLVLRLYDPSQGRILADGYDLRELNLTDWRNCIGVVDQDTFVFNDTVMENIRIGKLDATDEEVRAAAQIANAHEFIENLASGYDTVVGNRGFRLSGGQRQRIAIARAVIREPDVLIFDEATSALDSQSEQLIQESLENVRQQHTVIMIAHRLSTVAMADRIIVLDGGSIVEQGTHGELLARNGRYADLWHRQNLNPT